MYEFEGYERFSKTEAVDFIKSDEINYKVSSIGEGGVDEVNSENKIIEYKIRTIR